EPMIFSGGSFLCPIYDIKNILAYTGNDMDFGWLGQFIMTPTPDLISVGHILFLEAWNNSHNKTLDLGNYTWFGRLGIGHTKSPKGTHPYLEVHDQITGWRSN
ncbi:hypothetical protein HAX54_044201, partial [Datura stramonium]|nr:hypothetical protein [Datura stramonium]